MLKDPLAEADSLRIALAKIDPSYKQSQLVPIDPVALLLPCLPQPIIASAYTRGVNP